MTKNRKLMLVRSEAKAAQIRPYISTEWMVAAMGSHLAGRRFSVILIADCDDRSDEKRWSAMMGYLRTKLTIGGKLIELY